MSSIVSRLRMYLDLKGINVSFAEKEINMSNGSLSKPFKNGTAIKTDTLEKFLFIYTDINSEWLLMGKGKMLKEETKDAAKDVTPMINNIDYKEIAEARLEIIEGLKFKIATFDKDKKATMSEEEVKEIRTIISRESSVPKGAVETSNRPTGSQLEEQIGK
jgi:hypothetical protein